MSTQIALAAVSRMNSRVALMAPAQMTDLAAAMRQLCRANPEDENLQAEKNSVELLAAYGFRNTGADKPFAFANGLAFIPIHGALINRFGQSWGYVTGYNYIRAQYNAALADDDVLGVVFDVNSYGGEAAGCFELADELRAGRSKKPSLAVVDHASYSAGYALSSAASKVVVTPSGGAGSVGVIAIHMSMAKMLDEWGIEVTLIFAGDHKADGNQFESLPESVRKDIQASVDKSYTRFTTLVSKNRGLDVQKVIDTQARCFDAEDAMALGLIDAVATPAQAVAAFLTELSGSTTLKENSMGQNDDQAKTPGAAATAAATGVTTQTASQAPTDQQLAEARKAERVRMSAITGCEEAKGKPALASHLATNTELSVEEAKALLAVAAPEQQASPGKPEENKFAAAMNASDHPNVGADSADGTDGQQLSAGKRILADYQAATGVKLQ